MKEFCKDYSDHPEDPSHSGGFEQSTMTRRCWASSALCADIGGFNNMSAFVTTVYS